MKKKNTGIIILFLAPTIAIFILYLVIPLFITLYTGFTKWDGINSPVFDGLKNYSELIKDSTFWVSVKNTVIWIFAAIFIQLPISAVSAIILSKKIWGWKAFRVILFFPALISGVTLGTMWRQGMYDYNVGAVNELLKAVGLSNLSKDWLGDFNVALIALLCTFIFYSGLYLVILLAKITSIPTSMYEAAEIDGASGLQKDLYITIPFLKAIYGTCIVLATIGGLKTFDLVYIVTGGGPGDTTYNLGYFMYTKLNSASDYGSANAVGTILLIIGLVAVMGLTKLVDKWEIQE